MLVLRRCFSNPAFDFEAIRSNATNILRNAAQRKVAAFTRADMDQLLLLSAQRKALSTTLQETTAKRNAIAKSAAKSQTVDAAATAVGQVLRQKQSELNKELAVVEQSLIDLAKKLPNASHPDAPVGDYDACRIVRQYNCDELHEKGHVDHVVLAKELEWADWDAGVTISGPRWPVLLNEACLLELALINYALATAISKGFSVVFPPDVVKTDLTERCGFRPRDSEASQTFFVSPHGSQLEAHQSADGLALAATAEIPLAGYFSDTTFTSDKLPRRAVALGRAFRAEAGSRGKESKGLYRVHQFTKAEMFVVCGQDASGAQLEEMVALQECILSGLELPIRTMDMSTEELGASAYRKYDIECWMPGRASWGELASASNCTDYQARRLGIKYKTSVPGSLKQKTVFAHTLNATAAAVPRLIIALLENGASRDENGTLFVKLPRVLQKYWVGPADEQGVQRDDRYVIRWT